MTETKENFCKKQPCLRCGYIHPLRRVVSLRKANGTSEIMRVEYQCKCGFRWEVMCRDHDDFIGGVIPKGTVQMTDASKMPKWTYSPPGCLPVVTEYPV